MSTHAMWFHPKRVGLLLFLLCMERGLGFVLKQSSQMVKSSSRMVRSAAKKETVAIIGGGIAGLSCAQELSSSGKYVPTVFDTGRLRAGGRCSSRLPGDVPKEDENNKGHYPVLSTATVDHAAQVLTVPKTGFSEFSKQVEEWKDKGVIVEFPKGTVCNIQAGENKMAFRLQPLNVDRPMYYGANGMGSIPLAMLSNGSFVLEQDIWVAKAFCNTRKDGSVQWKLKGEGKTWTFDKIVVAHNGKCADRLMRQTPAKALHSLLRTNFSPTVPAWGGNKMTLNSIYSLTFVLDKTTSPLRPTLPEDAFVAGFVQNEPNLRFLSCHTRKYQSNPSHVEIWTLLSSPKFAKKHKAPQEFLPEQTIETVTDLMLEALEQCLSLPDGSLRAGVLESRLQLWGAAVPLNTWDSGFVYDADTGAGVCGDWLVEPSIAGAWESGRRLAQHMNNPDSCTESAGLPPDGAFRTSKATQKVGIGSL